jgi:hypothetical protein
MRTCFIIGLIAISQTANAGVGYEESDYLEMADLVVEATVSNSDCLSFVDGKDTLETDYKASLTVATIIKGEADSDTISITSRVIEYKGDQPSCGSNGRIHPAGETATFYLKETSEAGVFEDVDQFSTFPLEDSNPDAAPTCLDTDENKEEAKGCSMVTMTPSLLFGLPLLVLPLRRKRRQ